LDNRWVWIVHCVIHVYHYFLRQPSSKVLHHHGGLVPLHWRARRSETDERISRTTRARSNTRSRSPIQDPATVRSSSPIAFAQDKTAIGGAMRPTLAYVEREIRSRNIRRKESEGLCFGRCIRQQQWHHLAHHTRSPSTRKVWQRHL